MINSNSKTQRATMTAVASVAVLVVVGVSNIAFADAIAPGFDLFNTPAGSTSVELVDPNGNTQTIQLKGDSGPIIAAFGPGVLNTDTIVERKQGLDPLDSPNGSGVVDIELVALSLVSVDPVDISGTLFDVRVLSGDLIGGPSSNVGQMTINHDSDGGGTFLSFLPVSAEVIATAVGDPSNQLTFSFDDVFQTTLSETFPNRENSIDGGLWSHDPPPMFPRVAALPSGGFHAATDPNDRLGGGVNQKVWTTEQAMLAAHGVIPPMPEPGSAALFALGGLMLLLTRRSAPASHR